MKNMFYIMFLLFPFSGGAACEDVRFNEVKKGFNRVVYDVSHIIVTSKGRAFFMISHSKSVSQRKLSSLMVIRQYHMHHIITSNI